MKLKLCGCTSVGAVNRALSAAVVLHMVSVSQCHVLAKMRLGSVALVLKPKKRLYSTNVPLVGAYLSC